MYKYIVIILFILLHQANVFAYSIIQDDEIENTIRAIISPIFKQTELHGKLSIHIINNNDINAFVTRGNNVFINTGLLNFAKDEPKIIAGVMAHEFAHIAQNHVSLKIYEFDKLKNIYLTGSIILGTITSIITGTPSIGLAVINNGMLYAEKDFMKFSRIHEQAADKIAVQYLANLGMSPSGLLQVLRLLEKKERVYSKDIDPYFLTHPLSKERINYLEQFLVTGKEENIYSKEMIQNYKLAMAKLYAFTANIDMLNKQYQGNDIVDVYVQSIIDFRNHDIDKSLKKLDILISQHPINSYFYELKAQFLYETGDLVTAESLYKQAIKLNSESKLLQIALADTLLAQNKNTDNVISMMQKILIYDNDNPKVWSNLAIAFGKSGYNKSYYLSLGAKSALIGNLNQAKKFVATSKKLQQNEFTNYNIETLLYINNLLSIS